MPEDMRNGNFGASLDAHRMRDVQRNLALAAETIRLVIALKQKGVRVIPFKGAVLSTIAFGNLTSRQPGDIDLLVRPEDVEKAASVLNDLSYRSLFA